MGAYWTEDQLYIEQIELERVMHDGGVSRFKRVQRRAIESGEASATSYNSRLTKELVLPLSQALTAHQEYYRTQPGKGLVGLKKLRLLDPLHASFISIKVIFDSIPLQESLQATCIKIGRKIEDQVRFARLEETAPVYVDRIQKTLRSARSQSYRHKARVMVASEKRLAENQAEGYINNLSRWADWTAKECLHVGTVMVEVARTSLEFKGSPVFVMNKTDARSPYHLDIGPDVAEWIRDYSDFMSKLSPEYTPCVIPPRDWDAPKNGGYFTPEICRTLPLVKVNSKSHLGRLTLTQMPEVYGAVNTLQRTPWIINEEVLRVAERILERDMAIAMPQREPFTAPDAPVPEHLRELRGKELKEAMTEHEYAKFKQWRVDAADMYRRERKRLSNVIEVRRTIDEARKFSVYPALYFVYTLDSRGRVYCRSSAIGPQGGDIQKSMVKFARAKKLGSRGRYWLAVHGAGVWGNDKVDFDERVRFIEEDMRETIKDIVADPLTFKEWTAADKPWQFLSWCYEWAAMLDHMAEGNHAETFCSSIPVAMDGSCSGIQHYSAMLRDKRGGSAVNLTPSEKPSDIYGEVAAVVRARLERIVECREEVEVSSRKEVIAMHKLRRMARAWSDFGIDRKLCKKPVMTLPYGSTRLTCRESIEDRVADKQSTEEKRARAAGIAVNSVHPFGDASSELPLVDALALLTKVVWEAIGEVVVAARHGMKLIRTVAKQVSKQNKPLVWTTPTGFIVEQAIFKNESIRVQTMLNGTTYLNLNGKTDTIDPVRMQSSAAPNFVHSMDAAHLTRSVNGFAANGLDDIAVIHDSFGTHAGDTDMLRSVLRREFVTLYMDNVMQGFVEEVEGNILEEIDMQVPMVGTLDLLDVMNSEYAFS